MHRTRSLDYDSKLLETLDPEIDRTFHQRRREQQATMNHGDELNNNNGGGDRANNNNQNNANRFLNQHQNPIANRTMRECLNSNMQQDQNPIVPPAIAANNFEIKPSMIQMIQSSQFHGLPSEDPITHMHRFIDYCGTLRMNGVPSEAIRLILFPFSLTDKAARWFAGLPSNSIRTWNEMYTVFFNKYFPPTKALRIRSEINSFFQRDDESLFEAWERFKDLQRQCPSHLLPTWDLVQSFYKGINPMVRCNIDAACGGSIMNKTPEEILDLFEEIATAQHLWNNERAMITKKQGMMGVDGLTMVTAKLDALAYELKKMNVNVVSVTFNCELCRGDHGTNECILVQNLESVNYV